jgi:hypothetical protein
VSQVQLPVRREPRSGEVAGADDAGYGAKAIPSEPGRVIVEEITLRVQEAFLVEANGNRFFLQKAGEVFDQSQGSFGERLVLQIATDSGL